MDAFVFVSEEYPPDSGWGGIAVYTETIARAIAAMGHRAVVVTRAADGRYAERERDGVREIRLACGTATRGFLPAPLAAAVRAAGRMGPAARALADRVTFAAEASAKVRELIAAGGVRAVEAPDWGAAAIGLAIGRRAPAYAVHLHTPAAIVDEFNAVPVRARSHVLARLERLSIRRAAMVLSPTQELADRVQERFGVDFERLHVLPHPFRADPFCGVPLPATRKDFSPHILCVGRLEWRKGPDLLVRALPMILASFRGATVRFVGRDTPTGPGGTSMRAHLDRLAASLDVAGSIEYPGEAERDGLPGHYAWADLVVVPSRYDNAPYVCLEGQASARPVLAAACGGLPELIVDGDTGFLFMPGDPMALVIRAVEVLSEIPLRQRVGRRARARVRGHHDPATAARYAVEVFTGMPAPTV